jgi:hypothetical protein
MQFLPEPNKISMNTCQENNKFKARPESLFPGGEKTFREKQLSSISEDVFVKWYYIGISFFGIYIIFSILGKNK